MLGIIEKSSIALLICLHIAYCGAYYCHEDATCELCSTRTRCHRCIDGYYIYTLSGYQQCNKQSPARPSSCFPGSSMVTTPTGNVAMETVNIGDSLLTVLDNDEMKFNKVVGFAQREPSKESCFLSITAANQFGHTQTVKLTASHNIYVKTQMDDDHNDYIPRFAEEVMVGDVLRTQTDNGTAVNEATVTHVTLHKEMGVYNPLTETGTMLVDGTLVSCYGSFKHYLSHLATAPIRWFPWLFAEEKPLDGTLPYVETLKYIVRNYVAPIVSLN